MTEQEEKEYVIPKKRKKLGFGGTMAVVLIVAAGVLFAAYPLIFGEGRFDVETSDSKEFQDGFGDSPFGRIDGPDEPDFSANSQSSFDIGPLQDQLSEQEKRLQEENDRLKGQLDSLQGQLDSVREEAGAAAAAADLPLPPRRDHLDSGRWSAGPQGLPPGCGCHERGRL